MLMSRGRNCRDKELCRERSEELPGCLAALYKHMPAHGPRQDVGVKVVDCLSWVPLQVLPWEIPECSSQSIHVLGRCCHHQPFLTGAPTDELVILEIATGAENNQRCCPREWHRFAPHRRGSHHYGISALTEQTEQCSIGSLRETLG